MEANDTRFAAWLRDVDNHVANMCGLGMNDLPDVCYADWFEDGMSPRAAARKAVRSAEGHDVD